MESDDGDVDMVYLEEEACRAADAVRANLQSFSSSRHSPGSFSYERDPREWLRRETEDEYPEEQPESMDEDYDEEDDDDEPEDFPTLATHMETPPPTKRHSNLQRSNTPVISNQSKKQRRTPQSAASSTTSSDFQSPMMSPYTTMPSPSSARIIQRSVPSMASSHVEYQRFWEATVIFLDAKRQLFDRQARQPPQADYNARDCRIELDFLQALQRTCWDAGNVAHEKQGNFWLLLNMLRRLGTDYMLWDDQVDCKRRRQIELEAFKEELSKRVAEHPKAVLDHMKEDDAPAFIRRHSATLRWLEACFNHVLPSGVTHPRQVRYLENSAVLKQQGLPETDKDAELFECSLALLLAGRSTDAQKLWKDSNVPWRAIVFTGEEPLGYEYKTNSEVQRVDYHATGNDRRALWRHFQWIKGDKMAEKQIRVCCEEQGAIHAILGCNLQAALKNPSLRSWEKGLYVSFRCIIGRLEDEVLHRHNNCRRADGPYPGTQFEQCEIDHLVATSSYSNWEEDQIIKILESTPYPQMQCDDLVSRMMASFLIGKSAVTEYIGYCTNKIERGDIVDDSFIRFFVHLLIYLDTFSLGSGSNAGISDIEQYKNRVVQCYLLTLGAREDLWYLRVLYASRLPLKSIRDHLPPLLASIGSPKEREMIVEQLRDYISIPGLDVEILRLVVISILSKDNSYSDIDPSTPSPLDVTKMESIKWLSFSPLHLEHALEFTNILFRQFFLANKLAAAELFAENFLRRRDGFEQKMLDQVIENSMGPDEGSSRLEELKAEYEAYLLYLAAQKDYRAWKDAVAVADARPAVVDDQIDMERLDATSASIAKQLQDRDLIREKRFVSYKLRAVAQASLDSISAVLKYPGGWLLNAENSNNVDSSSVNAVTIHGDDVHRLERLQLRSKILPKLVLCYYNLCLETAAWMSRSLNDAMERLDGDSHVNVLMRLDESYDAADHGNSALAPWYWTAHAMNLADTIVSETYDIQQACDVVLLKEFADMAAESAVQHLMYESNRK